MSAPQYVVVWDDPTGHRCTTIHPTEAEARARFDELVEYLTPDWESWELDDAITGYDGELRFQGELDTVEISIAWS